MGPLILDLRVAVRSFMKNPAFAIFAIVGIAMGIGSCTAVYSIFNGVMVQSLGYPDQDRLVVLSATHIARGGNYNISYLNYLEWQAQSESFAAMGIYTTKTRTLTGSGRPQQFELAEASASVFGSFGIDAQVGRLFDVSAEQSGRTNVIILTDHFWRSQFGADPEIVGSTVLLDQEPFIVLGVLRASNDPFWRELKGAIPLEFNPEESRGMRDYFGVGRLKAGVELTQARAEMEAIGARLSEAYPNTNATYTVALTPILQWVVGRRAEGVLWMLMVVVGSMLLIACANVANLLLARASVRKRDLHVRSALGATRWFLICHLCAESFVLATAGGLLGVVLAFWGLELLTAAVSDTLGRADQVRLDGGAMVFACLLSFITALLCSLAPVLSLSKISLTSSINEDGRGGSASRSGRLRRDSLVVAQVAMALSLVLAAGLMIRSFRTLSAVEIGIDATGLVTAQLNLPPEDYDYEQIVEFGRQVTQRIEALPGVSSASVTTMMPLVGRSDNSSLTIEGYVPPEEEDQKVMIGSPAVSPGYFKTMGTPLLAGRTFTEFDTDDSEVVVIINRSMARKYWADGDAVGKRIKFGRLESQTPWMPVVGVVADTPQTNMRRGITNLVYLTMHHNAGRNLTIVARTDGAAEHQVAAVQAAIWEIDSELAFGRVMTMDDIVAENTRGLGAISLLLMVAGVIALTLAAIGLFGVISFNVNQRTQEIGIRMALGAKSSDVLRMILRRAVILTSLGVVGGMVMALGIGQLLERLMFGVSTTDSLAFVLASGLMIVVGLFAGYLPARRASRVDPLTALRHE